MLTRRTALAMLAATPLAVCTGCQDRVGLYYPLIPRLTWRYRVVLVQGSETFTDTAVVTNLPPMSIFDRTLTPQRSQLFGATVVRFLAQTANGIAMFAQQHGEEPPIAREPADYLLRTPITAGTSWSSSWESTRTAAPVRFPTVKTIASTRATVMVPAGTYADCLQVKIAGRTEAASPLRRAAVEVAGEEWYAPRIGFIKSVFREVLNQGEAGSELSMGLAIFDSGA